MKILLLGAGLLLIYLGATGRYKPLLEAINPPKPQEAQP